MITQEQWIADVKLVTLEAIGSIPYVGSVLKVALVILWPDGDKPNVWQQVEAQTEALIDKKLVENTISTFNGYLSHLQKEFKSYVDTSTQKPVDYGELGRQLPLIIDNAGEAFDLIEKNKYRAHLIPLLVAFAPLELAALREQYQHFQKVYSTPPNLVDTERKNYQKKLEDKYNAYQKLLPQMYAEWKEWRGQQIKITHEDYSYGEGTYTITDQLTKRSYRIYTYIQEAPHHAEPPHLVKEMFMNEAIASMASVLSGGVYLHNYLPDRSDYDEPVYIADLNTITLGPYAHWSYTNILADQWWYPHPSETDQPGVVNQIQAYYSDNVVQGIRFFYADHAGKVAGTIDDDASVYIPDADRSPKGPMVNRSKHVVGFNMSFAQGLMASFQGIYSDKSTSPQAGSTQSFSLTAAAPTTYRLNGVSYGFLDKYKTTGRISTISFNFRYAPPFTTLEATSSSPAGLQPYQTTPLRLNGQPLSQPVEIERSYNLGAIEFALVRARDGALVYHHLWRSTPGMHWDGVYDQIWQAFYKDIENLGIATMPDHIMLLSTYGMSGLTHPSKQVAEFLISIGAGESLSQWANNPKWTNTSDPHYYTFAYILAGSVGAGEGQGIESMVHGPTSETTLKMYLCDGKLQKTRCKLNKAK